jgi:hypothetical protein
MPHVVEHDRNLDTVSTLLRKISTGRTERAARMPVAIGSTTRGVASS